jgi:rubrerythrin
MDDERETSLEAAVMVLRCSECGDTFPAHEGDRVCPTCGSTDLDPASEPLL